MAQPSHPGAIRLHLHPISPDKDASHQKLLNDRHDNTQLEWTGQSTKSARKHSHGHHLQVMTAAFLPPSRSAPGAAWPICD